MKIKLFWSPTCRRCPAAKEALSQIQEVEFLNVEQADGLAQASYYGVMSTPSIVVVDETEKEVFSWHGRMPETDEIRKWI